MWVYICVLFSVPYPSTLLIYRLDPILYIYIVCLYMFSVTVLLTCSIPVTCLCVCICSPLIAFLLLCFTLSMLRFTTLVTPETVVFSCCGVKRCLAEKLFTPQQLKNLSSLTLCSRLTCLSWLTDSLTIWMPNCEWLTLFLDDRLYTCLTNSMTVLLIIWLNDLPDCGWLIGSSTEWLTLWQFYWLVLFLWHACVFVYEKIYVATPVSSWSTLKLKDIIYSTP